MDIAIVISFMKENTRMTKIILFFKFTELMLLMENMRENKSYLKYPIFKIVGVGGGGCSAIDYIYGRDNSNYSFIACDTDLNRLLASSVQINLLIGIDGYGNIRDPKKAKREAIKSKERIKKLFSDSTRVCFIIAGMGGGTGTGVSPVIASIAKQMGIFTIGIVTTPYHFEGKRKLKNALEGVQKMSKNVDKLIIINYESIKEVLDNPNLTVREAYMTAYDLIFDKVNDVYNKIVKSGLASS